MDAVLMEIPDSQQTLERDDIRLNRKGILNRPQIRFNLLAGKAASMDGETLLRRSA
jgi:hypothetical protein